MQIVNVCPECGSSELLAQKKAGFNKFYKCETCCSLLKMESESKVWDIYIAGLLLIVSMFFLSIAVFFVIIRNIFTNTYVVKIVKS